MKYDEKLDARNLSCPLPLLRAKKTITSLNEGQTLYIVASDPGSKKDFAAFAKQTGHELLNSFEENGEFHFFLQKKKS